MKPVAKPILLALFLPFFTFCAAGPAAADANGRMIRLEGKVTVDGAAAELNMAVAPGARIITGSGASCEITFNDRNIIRLFENSDMVLDLGRPEKQISLKSGALANVIKKLRGLLPSRTAWFSVETPTAVAGIRGTSFFVKVENDVSSYICCCNGAIEVKDGDDRTRRDIEAAHHKAVRLTKTDDAVSITDAPMLYHEDDELEATAGRIGVQIDWNVIDREME